MSGMPKTWRDYQDSLSRRPRIPLGAAIVIAVIGAVVWAAILVTR